MQNTKNIFTFNNLYSFWEDFKSLYSIKQFEAAIKIILFDYLIGWPTQKTKYLHNGYLIYNSMIENDRESLFDKIKETNNLYLDNVYKGFQSLDSNRLKILDQILFLNMNDDVEVKIFLTPIHPETNKYLMENSNYNDLKNDLIDYILNLKKEFLFEFYDFSEIKRFNGLDNEFYDGEHIRYINGNKIIDNIFMDFK